MVFDIGKTGVGVAPNGWVYEILNQFTADGFVQYDYQVWTSQKSKDNGDKYHIWNNHKSQFRENHQRIVQGTSKGVLWQPDKTQPPVEITDFAEFERTGQAIKYKPETVNSKLEWESLDGKKIQPFVFPTYQGVDEALDPQYVREQFVVSLDTQIEQAILEYISRASSDNRSGDLRGTTFNATVAASADDSRIFSGAWNNTSAIDAMGDNSGDYEHQSRFTNVTIANAATINSCTYTVMGSASDGSGNPLSDHVNVRFGFEAADNAAQISDYTDFTGRSLTATTVTVNDLLIFTDGVDYTTPTLAGSLQNVVDRGGWASGQAVNMFCRDNGSNGVVSFARFPRSYDSDTSNCGRLAVDYTAGGGGGATVKPLAALGVG